MKLVIVESPTKCTTIKRYLGDNYEVMASLGHIRDLATSGKGGLGVNVDAGFMPTYKVSKDKIHVVHDLMMAKNRCDEVILATDPDREGEAIAWHLSQVLNLDPAITKRLEFHEITRDSINEAMKHPRVIDTNLVSSQETRRILDRIIGFKLSMLTYKKIRSRSAGRVQSATLKMICDHDREIREFKSTEYWNILVSALINNHSFNLTFTGKNGKAIEIHNKEEADAVLNALPNDLTIISVSKDIRTKESKEPFTTSTLQQEAFARLKFKTSKTQSVAQALYEGINVGGEHMGLITYMRTDSTRLSPTFQQRAANFITETYGPEYLGTAKHAQHKDMMQDAHEAIRPSSNHRTPESVRQYLTTDQYNLYKLIYNRALASLMKPKKEEVLTITLDGNGYTFKCELAHTIFKGYEIIYSDPESTKDYKGKFPEVKEGQSIRINEKSAEQKFTQPPAHFSEAKLVKSMEEVGIGRPSTYASTIDILRQRKYVDNAAGILTITEQGEKTVDLLVKYFPDIIDVKYTAQMEQKLDDIEVGKESRLRILEDFYEPFVKEVESASKRITIDNYDPTGQTCPLCGKELVYKDGKNGKFIGCSNYPTCHYVQKEEKAEPSKTGELCPTCGSPLVERFDKKGNKFIACSSYPKCKYIKQPDKDSIDPKKIVKSCPNCTGSLIKKRGKFGYFLGCTNFPTCTYMEKLTKKKRK